MMAFPFDQHPLPGGLMTNWPVGSVGYQKDYAFAEAIVLSREIGFGRMIQMCEEAWRQWSKQSGHPHAVPSDVYRDELRTLYRWMLGLWNTQSLTVVPMPDDTKALLLKDIERIARLIGEELPDYLQEAQTEVHGPQTERE